MPNQNIFTGVVEDPRIASAKACDYQAEEVVQFATPKWVEESPERWRRFPVRNQNGSSTCVAQTGAKMLGIENILEEMNNPFKIFSALDIYDRRQNKPQEGMWGVDALTILSQFGATTDDRLPSQLLTEAQANRPIVRAVEDLSIADKYRAGGYVQLPFEIDKIAAVLEIGKPVMLFFSFGNGEWNDVPELKISNPQYRHSITGVDKTIWKGEKAIIIEDSWGNFNAWHGQRVITEKFLKERLFFAGYLLDLSNDHRKPEEKKDEKPHYKFIRNMGWSYVARDDVKKLQDILRFEGYFPKNQVSTGKFLQITAKALQKWQITHGIMDFAKETNLQKIWARTKTLAELNKIYS